MDYEKELEIGLKAARAAGDVIDEYYQEMKTDPDGMVTDRKSSYNDVVTKADTEAQSKIIDIIEKEFPNDGFLAEEEEIKPEGEERVWIVDPLDGTADFASGLPCFSVSIAFKEGGERKLGVVHSPRNGFNSTYYAVKGEGAYKEQFDEKKKLKVSEKEELKGSMVLTCLSERYKEKRELESKIVLDLLNHGVKMRRLGSAALNLCIVAEGNSEAYSVLSLNEWDIAAGELILKEAGGSSRRRESAFPKPTGPGIELIATNNGIQEKLENLFDRWLEDRR